MQTLKFFHHDAFQMFPGKILIQTKINNVLNNQLLDNINAKQQKNFNLPNCSAITSGKKMSINACIRRNTEYEILKLSSLRNLNSGNSSEIPYFSSWMIQKIDEILNKKWLLKNVDKSILGTSILFENKITNKKYSSWKEIICGEEKTCIPKEKPEVSKPMKINLTLSECRKKKGCDLRKKCSSNPCEEKQFGSTETKVENCEAKSNSGCISEYERNSCEKDQPCEMMSCPKDPCERDNCPKDPCKKKDGNCNNPCKKNNNQKDPCKKENDNCNDPCKTKKCQERPTHNCCEGDHSIRFCENFNTNKSGNSCGQNNYSKNQIRKFTRSAISKVWINDSHGKLRNNFIKGDYSYAPQWRKQLGCFKNRFSTIPKSMIPLYLSNLNDNEIGIRRFSHSFYLASNNCNKNNDPCKSNDKKSNTSGGDNEYNAQYQKELEEIRICKQGPKKKPPNKPEKNNSICNFKNINDPCQPKLKFDSPVRKYAALNEPFTQNIKRSLNDKDYTELNEDIEPELIPLPVESPETKPSKTEDEEE